MSRLLTIFILLFLSVPAWALRCENVLITEGTPVYQVIENCHVLDRSIEHIFIEQNGMVFDIRATNGTVNSIRRV